MKINNNRTCVVTNKKFDKKDLIRFVIIDHKACLDKDNKLKGRGYYINNSHETFLRMKQTGIIVKRFKVINEQEFIDELLIK